MLTFLFCLLFAAVYGFVDYGDVLPEFYAAGTGPVLKADSPYGEHQLSLTPDTPYLTLDFATEVAGLPFFEVAALSRPTQIEVKYAEDLTALDNPYSDGPWTFSNGLSNTFRTETFNLTEPGRIESYFVQGGQRWETVRLLTNSTVAFEKIGFRTTAQHLATDDTLGRFSSSNAVYDRIWDLGARVVQVACIDAGNAPSTWDITPDGAFIRGQQTAQSAKGIALSNYTLSLSTKIVKGGTGWRVASSTTPTGAVFYLTSNYTEDTTFINTNRTLLPPNTLVFNFGYSIVNQSTLVTGWNQYFPLNASIHEDKWYNISTTITSEGYRVNIDGVQEILVPIFEAEYLSAASTSSFASSSPKTGTWGFGPWSGQEAYVKDVRVTLSNGTVAYTNAMTSSSTLSEYGVAPLDASVCLDGGKRDRLVWIGDFYHTTKVIASSTHRMDYVLGSIEYALTLQKQEPPFEGFAPISASLGSRPAYMDAFLSNYAVLLDYQDLFLGAIGDYFWRTNDLVGLEKYWPNVKKLAEARIGYIDPYSGLAAGDDVFYFLGPVNGSAVTALLSYGLQRLIPLAEALNDTAAAQHYQETARDLNEAVNRELWSSQLGTYALSISASSNYSLTSIAWTLLSGAANSTQAASMIAKLPDLRLGAGYKTSSSDPDLSTTQLSPNILGMLLEGLFIAHRDLGVENTTVAKTLLDDFWSQMVLQDEYHSGASWEYLYPDGSPGIDLFTSLAHPWGAAPTYVLPEYVLGITATSPGFKTWEFRPNLGALGLTEAYGTVPTPYGVISARWEIVDGGKGAVITALGPNGTKGRLVLPGEWEAEREGRKQRCRYVDLDGEEERLVRLHGLSL
ncbi:glycoside hydrolase family 78 protein [Zasmidium cellare ATCC 36951]|uniref:Glycoside hydrolase family 78 protein n=1 Tax=Zasmidium cellare ATCC 36951 TaxID=1080233 RepID=A0A6A6C171_ZASCE|nr:glycoside hydrolase family 78 protein [Zasmidium cellare ATCC 36951]KAF2159572.1 glycoside hydrolase family 78 protein [Zasmidium cellare ATCC 36951]